MQIKYHHKNLVARFRQRLEIRINDPANTVIKDHQLIGKLQQYRSFSVTGDIRVVYRLEENTILLYDIGSHNQVY